MKCSRCGNEWIKKLYEGSRLQWQVELFKRFFCFHKYKRRSTTWSNIISDVETVWKHCEKCGKAKKFELKSNGKIDEG